MLDPHWLNKDHVVLVAAPSGGGKSYFLNQLKADQLTAAIKNQLPDGLADWPIVEANDFLKRIDRPSRQDDLDEGREAPRVLAHYDIVFIRNSAIDDISDDPAHEIWTSAQTFTIVTIDVSLDTLRKNFADRARRNRAQKSSARRLWADWVKRPLRKVRHALSGKKTLPTTDLFTQPEVFEALTAKWDAYLNGLSQRPNCAGVLRVRPDQCGGFELSD